MFSQWIMPCTATLPDAMLFENEMYIGINLQNIMYGIELVLYFKTMKVILARRRHPHKCDMFYVAFSTLTLVLITIWIAAMSTFGQKAWLLARDYPGGPMAYQNTHSSDLYVVFGRFSLAILQQMADALMIYRCRIVWGSRRIVVVPTILWLINLGLGMLLDWTSSIPGTTFFTGNVMKYGLAYNSSSTFLNVTLSIMICYRLLRHARWVKKDLGDEHASPYIAIVALVIESMLPFTMSSIAFLVSYGMESQGGAVFSLVHPLVMCLSLQTLILRVVKAKAWQKDEMGRPESIIRDLAHQECTSNSRCSEGDGVVGHLETMTNVHPQPDRGDDQV